MKKIYILQIFVTCLIMLFKSAEAQTPILYYDFENNLDRTDFENAVESFINTGSGPIVKVGGNGSAVHIRAIDGAGLFNQGIATGEAITTQQGGWSSEITDPGINAEYYYQFVVNTSGFGGIVISFDNQAAYNGPARMGVLWSTDGVNFNATSTPPALTGNGTYNASGQFILPSGADNKSSVTIRIYAYEGSSADRTERDGFSSHGKFSIDNLTVSAGTVTGSKTLLNETNLYTCVTSGSTGSLIGRNSWTVSSGGTAILSSNISLGLAQALIILEGGTITMGTYNLLEAGPAVFKLAAGGNINIGSLSGITSSGASGNIQTSTRNFNTGANYNYTGAGVQVTGNGLPTAVNRLTINNASGVGLSSNTSVVSQLTLTSGAFSVGENTLAIQTAIAGTAANLSANAFSSLIVSGSGSGISLPTSVTALKNLTVSNSNGLNLDGDLVITNGMANISGVVNLKSCCISQEGTSSISGTGTIKLTGNLEEQIGLFNTNSFKTTGTFQLAGTGVQTLPADTYNNIYCTNAAGINLGGDVIISGTLTLLSGNGPFNVGENTLTLNNPVAGTGASTLLKADSTSSLKIGGMFPGILIPSSIPALKNLNISNNQVVTAAGNLKITGTLTLEQSAGFLNMGPNTLTIGSSVSKTGELVREGGSIRGTIKRWFSNGTSADKLFPLDNGFGAYSEAKITFNTLTTGGSLTASFRNSGSGSLPNQGDGNYIPAPEMHINLVNLAPQYWTITAGDGLSGANYNLELVGDGIPNISNLNFITIVKRNDASGPWTWNNANHVTATGTNENPVLRFRAGTSFSDFGVGGNIDNLLPIELESFTSFINGRNLTLNWTTSSEENNSGFDIERKFSNEWKKIGNVTGNGTSNVSHNYSFLDKNLTTGKYNYRLKQIDYNGNYKYYELSNEITIGTPAKYSLAQNFPNPFNPATSISYEIPASDFVSLKIYDMMGKEVANLVNQTQESGFYTVKFDTTKLSSGVYFYKLDAGTFSQVRKMAVTK
jgi:hypothetical protein